MGMLSALARSPMGKKLLEFREAIGLPDDWEDPKRYGVSAHCTGRVLDNRFGTAEIHDGSVNDEILVHLKSPAGTCVVNLNTLLALGCAYITNQYRLAEHHLAEEAIRKAESDEPDEESLQG